MKSVKTIMSVFLLWAMAIVAMAASSVNINTADAKTLAESLSGIGLRKAQAIVEYRKENGPFKAVEGITAVKGIGDKVLEDNIERISID